MKKSRTFIVMIILSLLFTMMLSACQNAGGSGQGDIASESGALKCEVLIDFENIRSSITKMRLHGYNAGEFNTDPTYATQGTGSIRVCPTTEGEEIPDYSDSKLLLYPQKHNFSDTEYVSVDIYNPYEEPLRAEFGYSTVVQSAIVQPGKNTLWLHIDRIKLDFVKQGENESFFVHVDNPEGKMPDYYVDNLCAYTTEIPFQPYERDMANNIKLSFENNAETSFITHDSRAAAEKRVVCTINRDARYVKSGNGSLKAEYQAGGYGTFSISSDAIGDLNEYLLDPYDMIIPVYNPNDFAVGLTIQVYGDYQSENMFLTQQIAPDSWCDFSFSVEQMSAYFTGDGLTIGTIRFYADGMMQGGTLYVDSVGVYPAEQED